MQSSCAAVGFYLNGEVLMTCKKRHHARADEILFLVEFTKGFREIDTMHLRDVEIVSNPRPNQHEKLDQKINTFRSPRRVIRRRVG